MRHFRDRTWAVRVPRDLQELALRVKRTGQDATVRLGRDPSVAEHRLPAPATLPCSLMLEDERATIAPIGRLDRESVPVLDAVLSDAYGRGFARIVLDLRSVSFIDAVGVGLLLRWAAASARTGSELLLQPGSDRTELVGALRTVLGKHYVDAGWRPE